MQVTDALAASGRNTREHISVYRKAESKHWLINWHIIFSLQESRGYESSLHLFACSGRFSTEVAYVQLGVMHPSTKYLCVFVLVPIYLNWHLVSLSLFPSAGLILASWLLSLG
jgi:hypothetical protein